ncbi:MAG: hypothetical protein SYC29_11255 [Planctomycetota bacterium]|nr:hypothetical protein [Planctomycetota bacterium]
MKVQRRDGIGVCGLTMLTPLACALLAPGSAAMAGDDPLQVAKLVADDGTPADLFGDSVALRGDLILVGAFGDGPGSAYVFARDGAEWSQQAKLVADDGSAFDFFGDAVAADGETVVIGAPAHDGDEPRNGAAYVFTCNDGQWTQQAKLVADTPSMFAEFGGAVALEDDTIIVGAEHDEGHGTEAGAAYVFTREGTEWTQQTELVAEGQLPHDHLGCSVDICADTAVIGAYGVGLHSSGAAHVFVRDGDDWTRQAQLTPDDPGDYARFGCSVAIDGDTIVAGAFGDDENGYRAGAAYVFVRDGDAWAQQAKLALDDGEAEDEFGRSADVSGDIAVIGSPRRAGGQPASGAAYVWVRTGESWEQRAEFTSDDIDDHDAFATSLAIEQQHVVVGTPFDDDNGFDSGSAYIFDLGSACPADFDGNGVVDTVDLLYLLGAWGTPDGDVDGDGNTDTVDLLALLGAWGDCP